MELLSFKLDSDMMDRVICELLFFRTAIARGWGAC